MPGRVLPACPVDGRVSGHHVVQQSGEFRIHATREAVWQALNDPVVLQRCIDGCDAMQRVDDTHFVATVRARIGPVSATFHGEVTLQDLDPPRAYTLVGAGKGGAAGFARGEAKVRLEETVSGETLLRYEIEAKVGGKLAQIGSRLIDGAARKMADDFFGRLSEALGGAVDVIDGRDATSRTPVRAVQAAAGEVADTSAEQKTGGAAVGGAKVSAHDAASAADDAATAMVESALRTGAQSDDAGSAARPFQPSGQGLVWLVVLGIAVLALVLSAL